jgi:formate dehydrogenase subunit delta
MQAENMVVMMNRIGEFFEVMPNKVEGETGVVTHIRKFWAPSMRQELKSYLDQKQGDGLKPFVLDALLKHEDKWLSLNRD